MDIHNSKGVISALRALPAFWEEMGYLMCVSGPPELSVARRNTPPEAATSHLYYSVASDETETGIESGNEIKVDSEIANVKVQGTLCLITPLLRYAVPYLFIYCSSFNLQGLCSRKVSRLLRVGGVSRRRHQCNDNVRNRWFKISPRHETYGIIKLESKAHPSLRPQSGLNPAPPCSKVAS
ncbi:hypothetical protein EVAR_46584_1 [Eumeta japonica]|uniref:Uncharacterized protein n=1 Tax=Eumeta variegata TaxID=151549 RepID=A0A4C1WT73_EUMVA|nr:hypothetical protein EVAR_46584_1 [Eumeta japonica]